MSKLDAERAAPNRVEAIANFNSVYIIESPARPLILATWQRSKTTQEARSFHMHNAPRALLHRNVHLETYILYIMGRQMMDLLILILAQLNPRHFGS